MQIRLTVCDMLFINYAVDPDRVRAVVPKQFELDTIINKGGQPVTFVSVVPFKNVEISSTLLPLPRLSFDQINYRAYVNAGEGPAVYFFDIKVNSRLVTTGTSILGLPMSYEEIEIATTPADASRPYALRYTARSEGPGGLEAEVTIGGHHESVGPESEAVASDFITERPIGYVSVVGGGIMKIEVEHPRLDAVSAHVEHVRAPLLESIGLLSMDESMRPHSVLYVREAVINSNPPMPWLPQPAKS